MKRFFKTPKGLLTIILAALTAVAVPVEGVGLVVPGLAAAVLASIAVDTIILRVRDGAWVFPSGALLTAAIVAMVLSPHEPWPITMLTGVVGVLSKYIARVGRANVFNPAAFGLVATFHLFNTGQSWWGALPEAGVPALALLLGTGLFIASRVNKMPMVLAFLGVYYGLFTLLTFVADPTPLVEIFRTPDAQASLYFAFFILTDPPTSPVRHNHQVWCGVLVAAVSVAIFLWVGVAYYLLAGVLAGNVWEAGRRLRARR